MGRNMEKREAYQVAYRSTDEYRAANRERMNEWRKTPEYQDWLVKSKEQRKAYKAKYRAAAGCKPREDIHAEAKARAIAKALEQDAKVKAREIFDATFMGAPKPSKQSMGEAGYYRWRYANDPEFMAKELDRAQAWKINKRTGYKGSLLKWAAMPAEVKEVKQIIYRINRELERKENENNQ